MRKVRTRPPELPYFRYGWLFLILFTASCASQPNQDTKHPDETLLTRIEASEKDGSELKTELGTLKTELERSKKDLALLHVSQQTLRETLLKTLREVETMSRGIRSGIWESSQKNLAPNQTGHDAAIGFLDVPALSHKATVDISPSVASGTKVAEDSPNDISVTQDKIIGPARMLADAELKMRRRQYGEATALLAEYRTKFPNAEDGGTGDLMLAECWLKLAEFENVLPVVRKFYLEHPNSPDLLKVKLIEASSHQGLKSPERAALLYREVIALSPQSNHAQTARASLEKLRDAQ